MNYNSLNMNNKDCFLTMAMFFLKIRPLWCEKVDLKTNYIY